jgi:hypothetical protein
MAHRHRFECRFGRLNCVSYASRRVRFDFDDEDEHIIEED